MRARCGEARERGFTLVEVMVSILLTVIAVIGIMGLYRVQTRATGYSRHTTEATVLGEDRVERLRSLGPFGVGGCNVAPPVLPLTACPPAAMPPGCSETGINERGYIPGPPNPPGPAGIFTRLWSVTPGLGLQVGNVLVTVCWIEEGDIKAVTLRDEW